jgi:hypothetical protein
VKGGGSTSRGLEGAEGGLGVDLSAGVELRVRGDVISDRLLDGVEEGGLSGERFEIRRGNLEA